MSRVHWPEWMRLAVRAGAVFAIADSVAARAPRTWNRAYGWDEYAREARRTDTEARTMRQVGSSDRGGLLSRIAALEAALLPAQVAAARLDSGIGEFARPDRADLVCYLGGLEAADRGGQ